MAYDSEEQIYALVRSFEDAEVPREAWKHRQHLVVALYYVIRHPDLVSATDKMRRGLYKLLRDGFRVDLEVEMPYHETLTVFWMRAVAEFNAERTGSSLLDKTNALIALYDKDYPLTFYSRELLFSDVAREQFVEGDL